MRQYFNEFNATNEQEIGRAMLNGVSVLHESLGQIEDSSVVAFKDLLVVGEKEWLWRVA
jgi:hypothetical protein